MTDVNFLQEFPPRSLVLGFDGTEPSDSFLDAIRKIRPFGIIFFSQNFHSTEDVATLTKLFRSIDGELEFLIDQEGGEKCRITSPPYCPPNPWDMREWSITRVFEAYRSSAEALAGLGITINLAPVADLGTGEYIHRRTFGENAEAAALRVVAAVEGILAGGLKPCVKHFPGLGSAQLDPHKTLPTSDTPLNNFSEKHWLPFKAAFDAGCPYVMTTHLLATALDSENPATYSNAVVNHLGKLGFGGKIFTDDLAEMAGAGDIPPTERISKALTAGHDVALWCSNFQK